MDCCSKEKSQYDYDILFIGSGSAAFAGAIKASEHNKKVGIIEKGTLGGTCVNVGCVPSKTLIRAAETKHRSENSAFSGIELGKSTINFKKLMDEKDALVEELRGAKYYSVLDSNENISLIEGEARFLDNHTLEVAGKKVTSDKIIISTGSKPFIPNIPGLKENGFLTSTSAFELKEQPKTMAILGGGYIALEVAQLFQRLGTQVTIVQRSEILFSQDQDVSQFMTKYLESEGIKVLNQSSIESVSGGASNRTLRIKRKGESFDLKVDQIVVATGRHPNTSSLNLEAVGIELNSNGSIKVNTFNQTTQDNVYAAGDVLESPALVYVAAYEGNLASENACLGNKREVDYAIVPWVIFSDPQVSGVGLSEAQAKTAGIEYDVSKLTLDNVPRAIAARDTRGFVKLLRKTGTDELIGARIVAPEGSELIMEVSLMMKYKIPISEVAKMMHPYLTLGEAIKLASQTFDKDVKTLSCCAS